MTTEAEVRKEVTPSINVNRLCEIMQNNKTQLALCRYDADKDLIIQCHQFVHCRDFMLDALVGVEDHRDMGIWGFQYKVTDPRPDMDNTSMLVKMPDAGCLKNFQNNFPILKEIENFLGWSVSYAEVVNYPDHNAVVWLISDKRWQHSAIGFSFYTYLLKCLTYPIKDRNNWKEEIAKGLTVEARYMDPEYVSWLIVNLNDILTKYTTFSGYKDQSKQATHNIHDSSGFVSMKSLIFKKENTGSLYETHVLMGYKAQE